MEEKVFLTPMSGEDRIGIIDIFNYYIKNTYAAYPENEVSYEFFGMLLQATNGYPALTMKTENGEVIGFGFLRPYHPMPVFKRTAEISYFLRKDCVGLGLGKMILDYLVIQAKDLQIDSILASICSLNDCSIKFHLKNGFKECGRFQAIGKKHDQDFDVVWMQKRL